MAPSMQTCPECGVQLPAMKMAAHKASHKGGKGGSFGGKQAPPFGKKK